ncbi:hypothetical protein DSAG12_03791 [Promethearchaeum syntrophicum]|uniref:ArnR1-like winged helix-turn-helix domain-containing protein n=1 Tax=Promethearchaeum syntrophicum TaxID=2594042 RepID=A0A5B9DGU8_9ARCH|nr:hypothetical protein [Candidatus Prometheoarchaeum syntrophicum]QEE17953.1 hypothetical protein DSAG12_03791 [Candidatus Prometheoarchaeum syntrophicum]
MAPSKYRSTNMIIQKILEGILRADINHTLIKKGIIKSHLIKYCALKASTAEKYLLKMINAGYIISHDESWGERKISIVEITNKGKERYKWFVMLNLELEESKNKED